jgi:glyoxylase-like metal-dependent hydrolase (beta-lactamase superfamily II)
VLECAAALREGQLVAPGLRRWTAWHEEWKQQVASLAVETRDGLVLIDPLDPPPELRRAEHVLITVYWHDRSAKDVAAKHVWASTRSAQPLRNRGIDVTNVFRAGDELPGGIRALQTARAAEVVYWLPEQRALAVGDVLLGSPLRLCPESWLGKRSHEDLRESLRCALDLPIERVLVSHGEPVLSGGEQALAALLMRCA